jgi:hypothetical protein
MAGKQPRTRVGAFSSTTSLLRADGRTAEARLMGETDRDLVALYGGEQHCSAARRYLIESTSLVRLRVAALRTRAAQGGELPEHFDKVVGALAGTLRANLMALGLDGPTEPETTLEAYVQLKLANQ